MKFIYFSIVCAWLVPLTSCYREHRSVLTRVNPLNSTTCPLDVDASLTKQMFHLGEEVSVKLDMAFSGGLIYLEINDFVHGYFPHVYSPDGEEMQLSPRGEEFIQTHASGTSHRRIIRSLYNDQFDFPLSTLYDFSLPGKYRVVFERTISPAPENHPPVENYPIPTFVGTVYSNEVNVDMVGD